jgi:uncharacterized protein YkwD
MIAYLAGISMLKAEAISITMSGHGPQCRLLVARPTISWQVWPEGDNLVSGATLSIDGKKQKASYNKVARSLTFTPSEPFSPGEHQVQAQIVVNGWAKFDKRWSFTVLQDAYEEVPEPSRDSILVINAFNSIRRQANLEPVVVDPRLCLAAVAHAAYIDKNPGDGHLQNESKPGFVGRTPAERMGRMGYCGGSWEVLVPSVGDIDVAVKRLFDAPYHRASMLNSGPIRVGGGYVGGTVVIDGEMAMDQQTVVSPAEGQQDVQPFWKDVEVPDPYRLHSVDSKMVGYPIMFVRQGVKNLFIRRFTLTDSSGRKVEAYENFPGYDDHLRAEAFIMPKRPLGYDQTYRVTVEASDSTGKECGKTWSFTTASFGQHLARTGASQQDALGTLLAHPATQLHRQ